MISDEIKSSCSKYIKRARTQVVVVVVLCVSLALCFCYYLLFDYPAPTDPRRRILFFDILTPIWMLSLIFPQLELFRSTVRLKKAIRDDNPEEVTSGLKQLKSQQKAKVIAVIAIVSLFALIYLLVTIGKAIQS
ncbi:MAG: hypothetical protein PHY99_07325 [Bacteroidales bacterium]|nr:hypothetical protein [Bacteroidales bacterium]